MWWASFGGALAGTALSVLLLMGIAVVWDYVAEHRAQRKPGPESYRVDHCQVFRRSLELCTVSKKRNQHLDLRLAAQVQQAAKETAGRGRCPGLTARS